MTCVLTWRDRHEHPLNTHIHVSGLSYFCTDDKLRQAFIPFGMVMLAQVLRDEWGHSLGLGIIHMARSEDVERVFNEHKRFEVAGSRVDLWEPAEPEHPQGRRTVVYDLRGTQTAQTGQEQETGEEPEGVPTMGSARVSARPDSGVLVNVRGSLCRF